MSYEIYPDYSQTFLFPRSLEDWVPADHPVRFIREIVDSLTLKELGFKERMSYEGRPNYSVNLLLKVWLYGLFERIKSSRQLEKACLSNIPMMWLVGMTRPDHNSIWRFFKDNRKQIKNVFKKTVRLAIVNDLVGFSLQALDGTKISAFVNGCRSIHKGDLEKLLSMIDESVKQVLDQVEDKEMQTGNNHEYKMPKIFEDKQKLRELINQGLSELSVEGKQSLKAEIEEKLSDLEESDTKALNITDKESRMMKTKGGEICFCYNAQAMVDSKNQVIVGADVTSEATDTEQLNRMLGETEETTGSKSELTVADGGYFSGKEVSKAEESGYAVAVNIVDNKSRNEEDIENRYIKDNFQYDETKDVYVCPDGNELTFQRLRNNKNRNCALRVYHCNSYKTCPHRKECSKDKRGRVIERAYFDDVICRHKKMRKEDKMYSKALKQRKAIVEPVFGWIKENNKFRRWSVRGLKSVKAQWYLLCSIINLKKLYKVWINNGYKLKTC